MGVGTEEIWTEDKASGSVADRQGIFFSATNLHSLCLTSSLSRCLDQSIAFQSATSICFFWGAIRVDTRRFISRESCSWSLWFGLRILLLWMLPRACGIGPFHSKRPQLWLIHHWFELAVELEYCAFCIECSPTCCWALLQGLRVHFARIFQEPICVILSWSIICGDWFGFKGNRSLLPQNPDRRCSSRPSPGRQQSARTAIK